MLRFFDQEFKQEMMKVFEIIDLRLMTFFLGMEIKQAKYEVFIYKRSMPRRF